MSNPFPLKISEKQDSWEKLQLLATLPAEFKLTAAEVNKIVSALDYLYLNGTGTANTNDVDAEAETYPNATSLIADQNQQEEDEFYIVEDGSTFSQDFGTNVLVLYKGTTLGTEADYIILRGVSPGNMSDEQIETAYNNQVPLATETEAEELTETERRGWSPEGLGHAIENNNRSADSQYDPTGDVVFTATNVRDVLKEADAELGAHDVSLGVLDGRLNDLENIEFSGIIYDTLVDAQAVSPAPANGTQFAVSNITDPNNAGYYSFQSGEPNGTRFERDFQQPLKEQFYDKTLFTFPGFIIAANGAYLASASYRATDFLKVEPNVSYTFVTDHTGNLGNWWYDENKEPLSSFAASGTLTTPEGARYVRLSTKNSNIDTINPYIRSTERRLNIAQVLGISQSFPPKIKASQVDYQDTTLDKVIEDPLFNEEIVQNETELLGVNSEGVSDRAYPIGRRVYDSGLRSEVYADGCFWRMPDGTAATKAHRTYVFPNFDETRLALPTYATAYKQIFTADSLTDWDKTAANDGTEVSLSKVKGFDAVKISHKSGTEVYAYYDNTTAIGLNDYFIFKMHANFEDIGSIRMGLFDASGTLLFLKILDANDTGVSARAFYEEETTNFEVKASSFGAQVGGADLADVARVGFRVSRDPGKTGTIYVGDLETVSFKPMITLRFDDQRQSVYDNAYPLMENYDFNGVIGVITGVPNLGNSPDAVQPATSMSKTQLTEVRDLGWDLVSHTHNHRYIADYDDDFFLKDYKDSVEYLKNELEVSPIEYSTLISPYGQRDERVAKLQRKYFDAHIGGTGVISHIPRQPTGSWNHGSIWYAMNSLNGDNISDGNDLIAHAQTIINEKRWGIIMMHDILPTITNPNATTTQAFSDFMDWLDANRALIEVVTIRDVVNKMRP